MNKSYLYIVYALALLAPLQNANAESWQEFQTPSQDQLTFFYSPTQLEYIKQLPLPDATVTNETLDTLNKEVSYLLQSTELSGIDQTVLPPYLANAQKDFAYLSYLLTGELAGDLGPVTLWTLQLFIPDAELPSVTEKDFDVYTSSLASMVVKKVAERLHAEKKQIKDYPIKKGEMTWTPTSPGYRGLNYGTMKTWFLTSSREHVADMPAKSKQFWEEQCDTLCDEQYELNGEKVHAVFEWAGLTHPDAGSWEAILNEYMTARDLPIVPRLYIRAIFLSTLADSNAAAFNSKYTYWIMRPSQFNNEVKPLVTIPNHPSYPSAHSTISGTAAIVLTEFFPEDVETWNQIADEAGMSRIWGGIHYPADHTAGMKLGKQVGHTAMKRAQRNRKGSYSRQQPISPAQQ